jgi:UDP-N-acetylmuramoyl-L-alanyl-D-glutamate--2,6-diaminopimelate ligase
VILTSDNPRTENPAMIIKDMEAGIETQFRKKVVSIENRREAIKTAALLAQPGDIILIAGKGHENYQEINGVKHHFDDMEEIKKCFGINE